MRFDLEIPDYINNGLSFIQEGLSIPDSLVPLLYYRTDYTDIFIDNFLTKSSSYINSGYTSKGFSTQQGPSVKLTSNRFLITHIYKYSQSNGTSIPLFYKHVIDAAVSVATIKIVDYSGVELQKDNYLVEVTDNKTYIYMNKVDTFYFVQFATTNSVDKVILDLNPVYEEIYWDDIIDSAQSLPKFKYSIYNNIITTSYNGSLYIQYLNDIEILKLPVGNPEDPWYPRILNVNFEKKDNNGVLHKYLTPELSVSLTDQDENLIQILNKKCKKIYEDVIQSQYQIFNKSYDSIFVYVYSDKNTISSAYTTNETFINTEYQDSIIYKQIKSVSSDGYIYLPDKLNFTDIVYATHFSNSPYVEYKLLDLNSEILNTNNYIAFYIKDNNTVKSIGFSTIGDNTSSSIQNFGTIGEYNKFIDSDSNLHIGMIGIRSLDTSLIDTFDVQQDSKRILNKDIELKSDIDILYNEILNNNIEFQVNDCLIAKLDPTKSIQKEKISIDPVTFELKDSDGFMQKIKDTLDTNLSASTKSIIEISL